jgi:hypothetical protein
MSDGYPPWVGDPANTVQIKPGNSPALDPFGRWRVSQPTTIFQSKQIHDNEPLLWDEELEDGEGIAAAYNADRSSTIITSTISTAGVFTRQTFQRFNYQSGKGQQIQITGVLERDATGTGVQRRVGYFDDNNGLFFEEDNGTIYVVRRSSISGTAADVERVAQADWNVDKMDGLGASRIKLDFSKAQLFEIDFQFLGTGRVRMGLDVGGISRTVHEFNNANNLTSAYMSTPDLPIRWQMVTTSSSPAVTMEAMCAAVMSEAGVEALGTSRYKSTEGSHISANTANLIYVVVGMRLKTTDLDSQVTIETMSMVNSTNDDFEWLLIWNPTVAVAVSFSDETNSVVETGVGEGSNPSTTTVTGGTRMAGGFVKASGSSGDVTLGIAGTLRLGAKIDGTRDEIYLCVRPLSANADVDGGLSWREA